MAKYKVIADNLHFKKKRYAVDDEMELTDAQAVALVNKVAPVGGDKPADKLPPEKIVKVKAPRKRGGKKKK